MKDWIALATIISSWCALTAAICITTGEWLRPSLVSGASLALGLVGIRPIIAFFWTGLLGASSLPDEDRRG